MKTAEYEIVRDFAARREQVYAAWTQPERFARWFGPRVFTTPADRVVLDVRPGGAWQATLVGEEGFEVTLRGVYREIAGPGRLVFTTGDPDATATRSPRTASLRPWPATIVCRSRLPSELCHSCRSARPWRS